MANEVEKSGSNPFTAYGNAASSRVIVGDLLKFNKGDYLAGKEAREVPIGTAMVVIMNSLAIGWVKWSDNAPTEHVMGPVAENFQPPKRGELGDLDKSQWEIDDDGAPKDPFQFTNYLVMVERDGEQKLYTFTTSSKGGLGAIGELCKTYGKGMRQHPNELPIVEIDVGSYQHSNKAYGRIKYPVFKHVGWVGRGPYDELLASDGSGEDGGGGQATIADQSSEEPVF
jgi:hypothetical protein